VARISRRQFLETSSLAAAYAWSPCIVPGAEGDTTASPSANDRPNVALVGCGGQGYRDGSEALEFGNLVAVCDVDSDRAASARNAYLDKASQRGVEAKIDTYEDYRAIIDRPDVDAVICGTVDHWHVKVSVEALRSGKDVYCEKPLTLTIDEGRIISQTVNETGQILQVGTQQRSHQRFLDAIAIAHSGRLGSIKKVTVGINRNPFSKPLPALPPPPTLNWNMWRGPTADVPYRFLKGGKAGQNLARSYGDGRKDASNCHYEFRWWYEYGGGKMTDWGAHHVDIAQWIIQQNGPGQGPQRLSPVMVVPSVEFDERGNPQQTDRYNVPQQFTVRAEFPQDVVMVITSEGRNGILVEGTEGRIFVNRRTLAGKPIDELESNPLPGDALERLYGGRLVSHMHNFFDCIANRKQPISDVGSHIAAINTCHLANIALRLNRPIDWDADSQSIRNDAIAAAMQIRPSRKGFEIEY
jgi:predicted dehydrogenase